MLPDRSGDDASIRRYVLISTASNYIGKIINLGAWFFLTPFILSRLSASEYGLWILVNSIVAYGGLLEFGIASGVEKYIAEYQARGEIERSRNLIATAVVMYACLGLIAFGASAVLAVIFPRFFIISNDQQRLAMQLVLVAGAGLALSFPCTTPIAVLRGLKRFDLISMISITGTLLLAGSTAALLLSGGGLLGLVFLNIPVTLLMQIPAILFVRKIAPDLHVHWRGVSFRLIKELFSFSSALFVINVSSQIQTKSDEIVIGAFLPVSNVTPYSIARRLGEMTQMLTDQFVKVLLPLSSQLFAEDDQSRLRKLYIASTRITLITMLPLGFGAMILARPFLSAWVGPEYSNYSYLVWILTGAGMIQTSQWAAILILQGMAKHRWLAVTSMITGIANLSLSIFLVRRVGLVGVALGTLIPTTIESLLFILPYSMRSIGVSLREIFVEVFLPGLTPAVPMAVLLILLRESLQPVSFIQIGFVAGLGLLVYGLVYLVVSARDGERKLVREFATTASQVLLTHFKQV